METEVPTYKRSLLTSRQVGIIAALGGLGFTWRALGLVIPLPVPGLLFDIRGVLVVLGAFAGGPYVSIVIGILFCLPSTLPLMLDFPVTGVLYCLIAKKIWNNRSSYGIPLFALWSVFVNVYQAVFQSWFLSSIAKFGPFMGMLIPNLTFSATLGIASDIIVLIIAFKFFPEFMTPRWNWRGGEDID